MTREEYLNAAVEKFRPLFERNNLKIPPYRVSCGFTTKNPRKTLGQCFAPECTPDGTSQIFVVPTHKDVIAALGTLAHELLHAASGDYKHGAAFKKGMKTIGLEGKATATLPGQDLLNLIEKLAEELGDFPNPVLHLPEPKQRDKAATKKSFKLFCPLKRNNDKGCELTPKMTGGDYTVTATRKSLKFGFPLCPGCSKEMEMEDEDFELYKLGSD